MKICPFILSYIKLTKFSFRRVVWPWYRPDPIQLLCPAFLDVMSHQLIKSDYSIALDYNPLICHTFGATKLRIAMSLNLMCNHSLLLDTS